MDNAAYATLTRQAGLRSELQSIANNVANASTVGYQREGILFSEFITALEDANTSLSMAMAEGRYTDRNVGGHRETGGKFDLAIGGEGYFPLQTPDGLRLTRAGAFAPNANGDLATPQGHLLLDAGGAPIPVPPDATEINISSDGSLSFDGAPVTEIGLVVPADPNKMRRTGDTSYLVEDGNTIPVVNPQIMQGFLEGSNVNAIEEITRLIEVQRAYEKGGDFMSSEDERIRSVIRTLGSES
ncbi:MAG: flagellar hook-basal body complex protein [Pseudomonadota bacterium]